jgi:hypothetical protein
MGLPVEGPPVEGTPGLNVFEERRHDQGPCLKRYIAQDVFNVVRDRSAKASQSSRAAVLKTTESAAPIAVASRMSAASRLKEERFGISNGLLWRLPQAIWAPQKQFGDTISWLRLSAPEQARPNTLRRHLNSQRHTPGGIVPTPLISPTLRP